VLRVGRQVKNRKKMKPLPGALLTSLAVLLFLGSTEGLSCPPGLRSGPTETPVCCLSGYVTTDACGTTEVCAKAVDDRCGGPWNTGGLCARNLQCLVKCPCFAKDADPSTFPDPAESDSDSDFLPGQCIFPFKFKGKEYNACTTAESKNGKPWCAYEVDINNVVVDGKWGDCEGEGCGIDGQQSCKEFDFNYSGRCVKQSTKSAIVGSFGNPLTYNLRDGISEGKDIQKCKAKAEEEQCRCADVVNCKASGGPDPEAPAVFSLAPPDHGWCFLENIYDEREPSSYCFDDVSFSKRHGRFWSSKACDPNEKPLDKEYTFDYPDVDIFGDEPPPPPPPPSIIEE